MMTVLHLLSLSSLLIMSVSTTLAHASVSEYDDADDYNLTFQVSYPDYELPLTDQDFSNHTDSFGLDQFDALIPPITDPNILEPLAKLFYSKRRRR